MMITPLKRSRSDDGVGDTAEEKRRRQDSISSHSDDSSGDDETSSWAPSSSSSEDGDEADAVDGAEARPVVAPAVYRTRSRGGVMPPLPADAVSAAMDTADEVVNAESDLSSDTSSDGEEEEEDECEEEDEENEDSSEEEDDGYSDDDSFVTSAEEDDEECDASQCSNECVGGSEQEQVDPALVLCPDTSAAELESDGGDMPAELVRCDGGIDELCADDEGGVCP